MNFLFSFILAFGLTFFTILVLRPLAIKIDLVDHPGGRKRHSQSVPLIGGIAMWVGIAGAILTLPISLFNFRALLAGALLLVIIGVLDDFKELSVKSRLIAQIIAGLLMAVWGGVKLQTLGNLFGLGPVYLGEWGLLLTVIAVLIIINAINMLDGLDGLAGSITFIALVLLCFAAYMHGEIFKAEILLLFVAVTAAFLCFNLPFLRQSARVFMGDAGSMLLGFVLVWFTISLSQPSESVVKPVTMLWIVLLPLFNIMNVIVRRLIRGRTILHPDRAHLHHVFEGSGWSKHHILGILSLFSLFLGTVGLMMDFYYQTPSNIMFALFIIFFIVYYGIVNHVWRRFRLMKIKKQRECSDL